jgi:hypothetical protein
LAAFADSADAEASPWHRELLLKGLEDHDFFVRATALGALTGKAKAAEVPAALASYRRALADSANDARIAVVAFIASAWRNDSVRFSDSLRTVIGQLPVPDDPRRPSRCSRAGALRAEPLGLWSGTSALSARSCCPVSGGLPRLWTCSPSGGRLRWSCTASTRPSR